MARGRGTTAVADLGNKIKAGSDAEVRKTSLDGYFKTMETNIIEKWIHTKSEDFEGREELWRQHHTLSEMQRAIELEITHGKQAKKKLEDMNNG